MALQGIMGPPGRGAFLRMSAFRIRHGLKIPLEIPILVRQLAADFLQRGPAWFFQSYRA